LNLSTPLFPALKRRAIVSRPSGARILSHQFGQDLALTHTLKPLSLVASGGTTEEVAEKIEMLTSAPKGAIDSNATCGIAKAMP